KTGTLTEGKPTLVSMTPLLVRNALKGVPYRGDLHADAVGDALQGVPLEEDALRLAAALEQSSEHPLAAAIVKSARERNLFLPAVQDLNGEPGKGIRGTVEGHRVLLGNAAMMAQAHIEVDRVAPDGTALRSDGQTMMYLAVDGKLSAVLSVADPIKSTTPEAVRALIGEGLRIVMLTGDNEVAARAVAARLGLTEIRADVLPTAKRDVIRELQQQGRAVAMAGDGINDAPALAEAAVGIAMGTGADVAIESAGITLVKGDLSGIVRARRLSRATMKNIRQNLFLAFIYNGVGVPVAAGVLYPLTGSFISPIWASAAMTLSSVSVIANALRLRRLRL